MVTAGEVTLTKTHANPNTHPHVEGEEIGLFGSKGQHFFVCAWDGVIAVRDFGWSVGRARGSNCLSARIKVKGHT